MTICSNSLGRHIHDGHEWVKILAFLCGPRLAFCDCNLKFWPQKIMVKPGGWEQAWPENARYANLARRSL